MSNFIHEINIDRIACPLHVLQIKQGMKKIQTDENLKVNSNNYAMPELLAPARQIGNEIHVLADNNTLFITK